MYMNEINISQKQTSRPAYLAWSFVGLTALLFGVIAPGLRAAPLPSNSVNISSSWFDPSGDIAVNQDGNQSGAGVFSNGNPHGYIEGSCVPVVHTIKNNTDITGDVEFSVSYDTDNARHYFDDLEVIESSLGNAILSATNLDQITVTGTPLSEVSTIDFITASGGYVETDVSGPVISSGHNSEGTYLFTLYNVPAQETVFLQFCARLGKNSHDNGVMQLRTESPQNNGHETLPINRNDILPLPLLTIEKVVDGGDATANDWSFEVSPAIDGTSVFTIAEGETSLTIDNVIPDIYTVTEIDTEATPAGYTLTSVTGENCATKAGTTVAGSWPNSDTEGLSNAICTFTNTYTPPAPTGTLTLHKIVEGGDLDPEAVMLFIDGENLESQIASKNNGIHVLETGTYIVSEEQTEGYTASYSESCSEGEVVILENEEVDCTITNTKIVIVPPPPTPMACDGETNMLINGSFESPIITDSHKWDVVANGTEGLGWNVVWTTSEPSFGGSNRPETALLEVWRGLNDWVSFDGLQHSELDTDWGGPGLGVTNEPAAVAISQDIATTPGYTYTVSFAYAGRPQRNDADNTGKLLIDGFEITTVTGTTGTSGLVWTTFQATFVASNPITTITLSDAGPSNSFGLLVDNVSVICEPQLPQLTVTKVIENGEYGNLTIGEVELFLNDSPLTLYKGGMSSESYEPGTYTVSETENPYYTGVFSGDCDTNGEVSLDYNDVKTCTLTNTYTPMCPGSANLIVNGGFEEPIVTNGAKWDIVPNGTDGLGWNVDWFSTETTFGETIRPETAVLEVWNGLNSWLSFEGSQNGELDTDWGGPDAQIPGEEPASVIISQNIDTVPGVEYTLHFAYSARPNRPSTDNALVFTVNGVESSVIEADSVSTPNWLEYTFTFTATTWTSSVSFRDAGAANSYGMLIDDVWVSCDPQNGGGGETEEFGYLTVVKDIINDDGGSLTVEDVELFVGENRVTSGSEVTLAPGTYTVSETPAEGYTGSFSENCPGGVITVAANEHATCTITNDDNKDGGGGTNIMFRIQPLLECVDNLGEGLYRAHFGYDTDNFETFNVPVGIHNSITGGGLEGVDHGQPTNFIVPNVYPENPGRTEIYPNSLFTVDFDGSDMTWSLYSDDTHTANASYRSPLCMAPEETAELTVIKEIINNNGGNLTIEEVELFVDGNNVTPGSTVTLTPGEHTVSETLISRYVGTFSGDCDANGHVTLEAGDKKTCTLTNDDVRRGGGGGGSNGGGGTIPTYPNDPSEPTTNEPEGRVLGETDTAPEVNTTETPVINVETPVDPPAGRVLGAQDELPRTGIPGATVALLGLMSVGLAARMTRKTS